MPAVHLPDGRTVHFPASMSAADIEAEIAKLVPTGQSTQQPTRDWGDTITDALPVAGGIAGGILGFGVGGVAGFGVGGVPGAAGGAALGAGGGEAYKQLINRYRGREAPATAGEATADINIAGAWEGLTAAGGGMAPRMIRGVMRSPVGAAAKGAAANVPILGPMGRGALKAVRDRSQRLAEIKGGRLTPRSPQALKEFSTDVERQLIEALSDTPELMKRGGSVKALTGKKGATVLNPEVREGMVSTVPDKYGATAIRQRGDVALDIPRDLEASSWMLKRRAETFGTKPAPRQSVQEQALMDALAQQEGLTKAGRSMLTPAQRATFARLFLKSSH